MDEFVKPQKPVAAKSGVGCLWPVIAVACTLLLCVTMLAVNRYRFAQERGSFGSYAVRYDQITGKIDLFSTSPKGQAFTGPDHKLDR